MTSTRCRLGRLFCCLLLAAAAFAAEPARTIVSDILYRADGSPASGTIMISWPAFVTAESVFGNKGGAEKKEAALNFVASALSIAQAVSNKEIADPDKFRGGLAHIIDGTVECLNASAWSKSK